jgi:hypothetical protein
VLHGSPVTVELLLVIFGSICWCLIGYGIGFDHGWKVGRAETVRQNLETVRQLLVEPLKCPVCGAGRSNAEISNGWCINCGVYSDGTP